MLALTTQFEAAWIGSPVRPWTRYAIPVALIGVVVSFLTVGRPTGELAWSLLY